MVQKISLQFHSKVTSDTCREIISKIVEQEEKYGKEVEKLGGEYANDTNKYIY